MPDVLRATVTEARFLTPHVREIVLMPDGGPLDFRAGQWLSLRLPVGERPPLNRAYSLATAPQSDGSLTLCFDRVEDGLGTGYLWDIAPSDVIEFTGPHGTFTLPDGDTPLLFIARYTGIVPFRGMLQQLERESLIRPVHLFYSAPEASEYVYRDELDALVARASWLTVDYVEDGAEITALEADAPSLPFIPYVCGIREFTTPVRAFLMDRFGFDRRAVRLEHFS